MQKESVIVVAIEIINKCVKMRLPNGRTVDILENVFKQVAEWIQIDYKDPESGGFILEYQHQGTGNVSLEYVTVPQSLDFRDRINFKIRDPRHKIMLLRGKLRKSYYMGVWHTHPQKIPIPSGIDWDDWNDTLLKDKTACEYVFFLISGSEGIRVWVGNSETKKIEEIYECEKEGRFYK